MISATPEMCVPTAACEGCPIARIHVPNIAAEARQAVGNAFAAVPPEERGTWVEVEGSRRAAAENANFSAELVSDGAPYGPVAGAIRRMATGRCVVVPPEVM